MTLTIYSEDFDQEDSVSDGLSGRIFLDPNCGEKEGRGIPFGRDLSEALKRISRENIPVEEILFCYVDGEDQVFRRFFVVKNKDFMLCNYNSNKYEMM